MRSSRSLFILLATMGGGLAACSSPSANPLVPATDAGTHTDLGGTDAGVSTDHGAPSDAGGSTDAGKGADTGVTSTDGGQTRTDGSTTGDATTPADAGNNPYDPCSSALVVDLNAMGTLAAGTTRITSNNNGVGVADPLVGPCGRPGHEVVFRYTPHTNARLHISTDNAGTGATFDTVVWARTTCSATGDGGVGSLGCDDDSGNDPRGRSSQFTTTAAAAMGTPLYIVVAGYTPPTGTDYIAQGTFELSVSEIATVAVGASCDPTGATNACATASVCYGASGAATGTCVADGAVHGACRATGTACDTGLTCNGSATSTSSRCIATVAAGGTCDPNGVTSLCATGTSCYDATGDGTTGTCINDGALHGACHATGTACNTGFVCNGDQTDPSSQCVTAVAVGGSCDPDGIANVCATGGSCYAAGTATTGTCVGAGALHGPCRATGAACDTGLACNGPVTSTFTTCLTAVALGGACDPSGETNVCPTDSTCVTVGTASTCLASGALGRACRAAAPLCDTGLACSGGGNNTCYTLLASAAACTPGSLSARCPATAPCLPTSATAGTCSSSSHAEAEPNSTPATAQAAITAGTIYSGSASSTDVDCFAVTVPAGGAIFAESNEPTTPACAGGGPDPVIDIYAPGATGTGTALLHADDTTGRNLCSTIDPTVTAAAHGLAAGTYAVCIKGYNTMVVNYLLTIGVFAGL